MIRRPPRSSPGRLAFCRVPDIIRGVHRESLLKQLHEYSRRHAEESEITARFIEFVETEPECFERSLGSGHVTGSAWVVNKAGTEVLLTHHRKLDCWLQLGGHADGDPEILSVATREAGEESGLTDFTPVGEGIFDIDIHPIPARLNEPGHLHYDVRYVLRAGGSVEFTVSEESHDLRWVGLEDVKNLTSEPSMARMVEKWSRLLAQVAR